MKAPVLSTVVDAPNRNTFAEVGAVRRTSTSVSPIAVECVVLTKPFHSCERQTLSPEQVFNDTPIKKEVLSCYLQN